MPDYQNGKIYKIVNDVNDAIYIGSTSLELSTRMAGHRENAKTKTTQFYTAMREIGVEHFRIILIKPSPCSSKAELEAEEYRVMKEMKDNGEILYNFMMGTTETQPMFGKNHTEETKQKISEKHMGRSHPHTIETKKKISISLKGRVFTEGHKRNISKSKEGKQDGENNPNFKFGSITKQDIKHSYHWVFTWCKNGKRKRKFFSVNKYGHEHAIDLCIEHRRKIYPNYQPKYVEIFFLDE
jgi:group I intron endonuclease